MSAVATKRRKRVTERMKREIAQQRADGKSYREIRRVFKISDSAIANAVREFRPDLVKLQGTKTTQAVREQIARFRAKGMSYKEIQERTNVSQGSICNAIREYRPDLVKQIKKIVDESTRKKAADLRVQGYTFSKIRDEIGVSRSVVIDAIKQYYPNFGDTSSGLFPEFRETNGIADINKIGFQHLIPSQNHSLTPKQLRQENAKLKLENATLLQVVNNLVQMLNNRV